MELEGSLPHSQASANCLHVQIVCKFWDTQQPSPGLYSDCRVNDNWIIKDYSLNFPLELGS